ncbi:MULTISPECIES: complex I NDUFA9 subunit family protein [unclassified Mesorhizobium]|uniref:complex I NDUFA9 subunit family protein n=1 Tax=unclassified Mesorhizobium TaxID=325217 RepID=UPI000FCC18FC|nr:MULTISPECIES: complex I NDUFA9 subunit family protein [unclassified Mesorhizobium]RUU47421.1 complex I NDUFA9 subunit family protein [Mesorhizobium sp. M6A.T.Ca.TU.002.02.2.1]RUU30079.1 complex I NDUFA9 subunit family protein [Mesorhizobium sp. M6A.T.Ce.TU.016.01.1.1]RVB76878.1 complex I NDUFA9 subunit family protein [Mesorhizobium sp. M6A.T.Cr.TU.014.01.1.1]RWP78038.1 MAG: complex I NDUFA9 subunit family protein [Mesorhizobium sp.]RWP78216.1 MAG: complex I NDUFA9 subunit family protein [Me
MTEILQTPKLVVVFGGSGFVGRHVVRALARRGYRIRVACRRPDLAGHLQPLGNVGQIQPVQANVRVRWSVDRAVQGADHVVNLVAILHESGRQKFTSVHEFGARAVAEAARAVGAGLTHISALGADLNAQSDYARTKALGEKAVLETIGDAVILRPSINFGPEDSFFNRFANMARYSPVLPLIGGGQTKFQPVYVGDVAEAVARSVDGKVQGGRVYELGGPQVLTFKECMQEMLAMIDRKRLLVSVPWWVANMQASILGLLPNPLLTKDQVLQLREHNIVSDAATREDRTLAGLGIQPQSIGSILPSYLWRYRAAGQFQRKTAA